LVSCLSDSQSASLSSVSWLVSWLVGQLSVGRSAVQSIGWSVVGQSVSSWLVVSQLSVSCQSGSQLVSVSWLVSWLVGQSVSCWSVSQSVSRCQSVSSRSVVGQLSVSCQSVSQSVSVSQFVKCHFMQQEHIHHGGSSFHCAFDACINHVPRRSYLMHLTYCTCVKTLEN
jgi:hypothetical protein